VNNGYPTFLWQESDEELITYTLTYTAGIGGSISGNASQTVNEGENGTAVTAVANSGYRFVRWSDNSTVNSRIDTNVNQNKPLQAIFERVLSEFSSAPISTPPGVGTGARDSGIIGASNIGQSINVGEIDSPGVNVLTYIRSKNNFTAPQSSNNWNLVNQSFQITNLDLFNNIATIVIPSESITLTLKKGESKEVDLDKDKINDIKVTFTDVYVNRAEITVKSLSEINKTSAKSESNLIDYNLVIKKEKESTEKIDKGLSNRLNGRLLLQVEEKGQTWYLEPITKERYFMGRPVDAFNMMRHFGLGISEDNFSKLEKSGAPSRFAGRILLRVEAKGEAYYINPVDMKMHYLGRPADAFNLMRELALGISNENIRKILVGEVK
jgi:hypothetical protein